MTVLHETTRKARKEHRCYNCLRKIEVGEIYTYLSGVWEGSGYSDKTHTDCREAECAVNKHYETDHHEDTWSPLEVFYSDEGADFLDWLQSKFPVVAARFPALESQ